MKKMLPCLMSVALGVSLPAHGHGRLADVLVIDRRTEQPLPVYYARGTYWVAGEAGARYGIAIRNRLGERLMAVTSVDGINVISGEPAAIDQVGYVLPAYVRFDVTGWRKSDSDVAAFEFTTPGSSYAARTGRPANVGVLGVAIFRERPVAPPPSPEPFDAADSVHLDRLREVAPASAPASAAGSARPSAPVQAAPALGTGHGARETSVITHTTFVRLNERPDELIRIRYDSYEHLVAMGIVPVSTRNAPEPFPGSPGAGYVPDPPR